MGNREVSDLPGLCGISGTVYMGYSYCFWLAAYSDKLCLCCFALTSKTQMEELHFENLPLALYLCDFVCLF